MTADTDAVVISGLIPFVFAYMLNGKQMTRVIIIDAGIAIGGIFFVIREEMVGINPTPRMTPIIKNIEIKFGAKSPTSNPRLDIPNIKERDTKISFLLVPPLLLIYPRYISMHPIHDIAYNAELTVEHSPLIAIKQ